MFNSILSDGLTAQNLLMSSGASIFLGLALAWVHTRTNTYSKNFAITLSILPLLVQFVIMMTSGSLGTGVAIMGAFSLVRFRSMPGTSRELVSVFASMAMGLMTGTGYLGFAFVATSIVGLVLWILHYANLFDPSETTQYLTIAMPEDLEHERILAPVFETYGIKATLDNIRLKNMGSIFELSYDLSLPKDLDRKAFIDDLRIRNRNLSIILGKNPLKGGL